MSSRSLRAALASTAAALLLTATFVGAQDESTLKITRHSAHDRTSNRITPTAGLARSGAFSRISPVAETGPELEATRTRRHRIRKQDQSPVRQAATALTLESFGTGGGDIFEVEPNDSIAQGVSLPINLFGQISFNRDVDFFAFKVLSQQQITVEAFAARLANSILIPDLALFNSSGELLRSDVGDEGSDPIIRYTPDRDDILIVGIGDADNLGGVDADYLLNITRGVDTQEDEPNDRIAQGLSAIPTTIFGEIDGSSDVDFYSFVVDGEQTLILDVDAEVLGSRLDAEINLSNPESGVEYFYNDQHDGDDSRFNIVLPYSGRYVIGIGAFNGNSRGFYRLNASLVPSPGAPALSAVTRLTKKSALVTGSGFGVGARIEINGRKVRTAVVSDGTLRAKGKVRIGDVITVANPPDDKRSNPLIIE
jgi:hypothetical protein